MPFGDSKWFNERDTFEPVCPGWPAPEPPTAKIIYPPRNTYRL